MDVTHCLEAKSDQLNNVDLIAGDLTITITKVVVKERGVEQPLVIHFVGDQGKPWKPCKNMARVLAGCYGADSSKWSGKQVKLYRDAEVIFGKQKTGGIRISHLSHIKEPVSFTLQFRRGVFTPFVVNPLVTEQPTGGESAKSIPTEETERLKKAAADAAAGGSETLKAWWSSAGAASQKAVGGAEALAALKITAQNVDAAKAAPQTTSTAAADEETPFDV